MKERQSEECGKMPPPHPQKGGGGQAVETEEEEEWSGVDVFRPPSSPPSPRPP